ncbi:MAG: NADH-quinone oxidoreductase subunit N [Vulcanimicrobiaceae bacterium]
MIGNLYGAADWSAITPLVIVAVTALVVLLVDLLLGKRVGRYGAIILGSLGLILAGVVAVGGYGLHQTLFGGAFVLDGFTVLFEEVIIIGALGSLVLFGAIGREDRVAGATALLLWSATGAMLLAGAGTLLTIFLGIELLSLALYCLCGLAPRATAREAALKYLLLSSTASGFLLYGMALLFGATGSVTLSAFAAPMLAASPLFWAGIAFFFVGIAFKLSLVPFHTWAPDVFQGAPLPVTAFMSVVTKAGVLAVLARVAYSALPPQAASALLLPLWVVAGISMVVGNAGMLAQTDLKRLIGYSGVAQVGYILVALAGTTAFGLRAAIYYLFAYTLMNLGAFAVAAVLSGDGEEGTQLAGYRGLGHRRPLLAAAMTFFLLALAGLPPTAGFLGKILILSAGVASGYLWLDALLIIGTAISLYGYAKVIGAMYARDEHRSPATPRPVVPLAWASIALCALALLLLTFHPFASSVLP